ncbi:MAG TPA: hypothetical protein ENF55_05210 [Thermoprotei archaeon]|nr:hypothetical protein [Thermoprotei archaeon]
MYEEEAGLSLGVKLFILGFLLIFTGALLLMIAQAARGGGVSGGVVVVVFPFIPVGVAWGDYASVILVVLTVIAVVLMIINMIIVYRRLREVER